MSDDVARVGAVEVGRRNQIQDAFFRKSQKNLLRGEMKGERERKESRMTQDSRPESLKWGGCGRAGSGHVKFEMSTRHPCREIEKEGGNTSLECMGKNG